MNVKCLELSKFTKHSNTLVRFPDRGLVIVTGDNGSGKSSIIEGVAYANWGETLRGQLPLEKGHAHCETDKVSVMRKRSGSKTTLAWTAIGGAIENTNYDTTTKAQEGLEAVIGSFDVWRRTHVFSSADAAHFTLATDKERKLFLESVLGLAKFDSALEKCRDDSRASATELQATNNAYTLAREREERSVEDIEKWREQLKGLGGSANLAELKEKHKKLKQLVGVAQQEVEAVRAQIAEAGYVNRSLDEEYKRLAQRMVKIDTNTCDACGQHISPALVASVKQQMDKISAETKASRKKAEADVAAFKDQGLELVEGLDRLVRKEQELAAQIRVLESNAKARQQAEMQLAAAQADSAKYEAQLAELKPRLDELHKERRVLDATQKVLGLNGVRTHILSDLLKGLEASANAWLPRLAGDGLRLELKPYSEKKSGGVSDAIGVVLHGAGGGSYRGASGGERRRVDLALLLAFAGTGTLFFDEVFDALDGEGVEAVGGVLRDLAKERCVVVITHNPEMVAWSAEMGHAAHWQVSEGAIAGA